MGKGIHYTDELKQEATTQFEVQPEEAMSEEIELRFDCNNMNAVNTIAGLNTFGLTATNEPAVDIVVLAATASGNGIVEIDSVGGAAAFALASVNVGAAGPMTPNSTQTFSVFATATGAVPLDPANNRIVVDFVDASGGRVGASSVAVMVR